LGETLGIQAQRFVRSRAVAGLVLLALVAHAFFAVSTHFHRPAQAGASMAHAALHSEEGRGGEAPLGGEEKQCLLCRLQRNLVSDLQHATLVIAAPPSRTPAHELFHDAAARPCAVLLRQGRAPPSIPS
jgi:hypothetical protein